MRFGGVVGIVLLVACGGDGSDDAADSDSDGATDSGTGQPGEPPPENPDGVAVRIGPVFAEPADEATICQVVLLDIDAPATVTQIRTDLSLGTHHVIVTRMPIGTAPDEVPRRCGAFAGGFSDDDVAFIAQSPDASLLYPEGTGLAVSAQQPVLLEMHYFNYLDDSQSGIQAEVYFDLAAPDEELTPVKLLFTGTTALELPPNQETVVSNDFPVDPRAQIFGLTSHTHQLGINATIELIAPNADPVLLHESTNWSEPPLDTFEPFSLTASQTLRLTCRYRNTSDRTVTFGTGFEDEMCFMWIHLFE